MRVFLLIPAALIVFLSAGSSASAAVPTGSGAPAGGAAGPRNPTVPLATPGFMAALRARLGAETGLIARLAPEDRAALASLLAMDDSPEVREAAWHLESAVDRQGGIESLAAANFPSLYAEAGDSAVKALDRPMMAYAPDREAFAANLSRRARAFSFLGQAVARPIAQLESVAEAVRRDEALYRKILALEERTGFSHDLDGGENGGFSAHLINVTSKERGPTIAVRTTAPLGRKILPPLGQTPPKPVEFLEAPQTSAVEKTYYLPNSPETVAESVGRAIAARRGWADSRGFLKKLLKEAARRIPGTRWKKPEKMWSFSLGRAVFGVSRFAGGSVLHIRSEDDWKDLSVKTPGASVLPKSRSWTTDGSQFDYSTEIERYDDAIDAVDPRWGDATRREFRRQAFRAFLRAAAAGSSEELDQRLVQSVDDALAGERGLSVEDLAGLNRLIKRSGWSRRESQKEALLRAVARAARRSARDPRGIRFRAASSQEIPVGKAKLRRNFETGLFCRFDESGNLKLSVEDGGPSGARGPNRARFGGFHPPKFSVEPMVEDARFVPTQEELESRVKELSSALNRYFSRPRAPRPVAPPEIPEKKEISVPTSFFAPGAGLEPYLQTMGKLSENWRLSGAPDFGRQALQRLMEKTIQLHPEMDGPNLVVQILKILREDPQVATLPELIAAIDRINWGPVAPRIALREAILEESRAIDARHPEPLLAVSGRKIWHADGWLWVAFRAPLAFDFTSDGRIQWRVLEGAPVFTIEPFIEAGKPRADEKSVAALARKLRRETRRVAIPAGYFGNSNSLIRYEQIMRAMSPGWSGRALAEFREVARKAAARRNTSSGTIHAASSVDILEGNGRLTLTLNLRYEIDEKGEVHLSVAETGEPPVFNVEAAPGREIAAGVEVRLDEMQEKLRQVVAKAPPLSEFSASFGPLLNAGDYEKGPYRLHVEPSGAVQLFEWSQAWPIWKGRRAPGPWSLDVNGQYLIATRRDQVRGVAKRLIYSAKAERGGFRAEPSWSSETREEPNTLVLSAAREGESLVVSVHDRRSRRTTSYRAAPLKFPSS